MHSMSVIKGVEGDTRGNGREGGREGRRAGKHLERLILQVRDVGLGLERPEHAAD